MCIDVATDFAILHAHFTLHFCSWFIWFAWTGLQVIQSGYLGSITDNCSLTAVLSDDKCWLKCIFFTHLSELLDISEIKTPLKSKLHNYNYSPLCIVQISLKQNWKVICWVKRNRIREQKQIRTEFHNRIGRNSVCESKFSRSVCWSHRYGHYLFTYISVRSSVKRTLMWSVCYSKLTVQLLLNCTQLKYFSASLQTHCS